MATEQALSDFLKSVDQRAFKRALYYVRDTDAALDIVQDSMMKLAEHYADKPAEEFPMLFQRILSNCVMDWFRRQKTQNSHFVNFSDFQDAVGGDEVDAQNELDSQSLYASTESAESVLSRQQIFNEIELAVQSLPPRQRDAFLMRYWEELDVAETAAAMGCTQGSVKTHCSRAIAKLSVFLRSKGIQL